MLESFVIKITLPSIMQQCEESIIKEDKNAKLAECIRVEIYAYKF
jgi:hypothetical protein